jgi:hypothetical protein
MSTTSTLYAPAIAPVETLAFTTVPSVTEVLKPVTAESKLAIAL